jgi:hypothetical protein
MIPIPPSIVPFVDIPNPIYPSTSSLRSRRAHRMSPSGDDDDGDATMAYSNVRIPS